MSDIRHHSVQVPATSANLGPGFDAFGLALTSYLVVETVPRDEQAERVATVGEGAGELSTADDNLIWRSLVAFCETHDRPVPDVALRAVNDLPLERGLGSSSSAIVAGLVLARALTDTVVGDLDLVSLADQLEGHPDNVAPAILGGLVACTRDASGALVVRRRNPVPHLRPLAIVPSSRQATTAARTVLPRSLPCEDVVTQASRAGHVLAGLTGAWPIEPGAAGDVLHEPPRFAAMRTSGAIAGELRGRGIHAWLSGAGPAVAALVDAAPVLAPADGGGAGGSTTLEVVRAVADRHGFVVHPLQVDLCGALVCPQGGCAISGMPGCVQCPRQRV